MKALVVYSSLTGNTEKIARSINDAVKGDICHIDDAPSPDGYEYIFLGFWVDKGRADDKTLKYMQNIKGKKVMPFFTLGAYPDSEHADKVLADTLKRLEGNDVVGSFRCQGKIDPNLLKMMESLPDNHPHSPKSISPERKARIEEAAKHPDENDMLSAKIAAAEVVEKFFGAGV